RADTLLTKESETIQWINGFNEGDVLWDIGANIGVYSLYGAIKRKLAVLAFEPSSANFYALTRNVELNRLESQVTALCIAFADQTSLGTINLSSQSMGAASNQFGEPGEVSPYAPSGTRISGHGMLGFTIDNFVETFFPKFPGHIKIDVDGLEANI